MEVLQAFAEALAFEGGLVRLAAMACKMCVGLGSSAWVSAYTQVHGNGFLKFVCSIFVYTYTNKATVIIMVVGMSCFLVADWCFTAADPKTIFPIARTGSNNVKITFPDARITDNNVKMVNDNARMFSNNVKTLSNQANFITAEAKMLNNYCYFINYCAYFKNNGRCFENELACTEIKKEGFLSPPSCLLTLRFPKLEFAD